jgi:hypothetical protein
MTKSIPRCLLLAVMFSLLSSCTKPMPEREQRARTRPATLDRSKLTEWKLTLNGVPFEGHAHQFKSNEVVHFAGFVKPVQGAIPPSTMPMLTVSLRPEGKATDQEWMANGSRGASLEMDAVIVSGTRVQKDAKVQLVPERFPPGSYDARLYFRVWDHRLGKSTADLIAISHVSISDAGSDIPEHAASAK